jgi:hypothetical protein
VDIFAAAPVHKAVPMQAEPIAPVHIDKDALARCCLVYGFDQAELISDIKARNMTRGTVTYYLTITSHAQINKNDYLQKHLCETTQAQLQHPSGIMLPSHDDGGCVCIPPPTERCARL